MVNEMVLTKMLEMRDQNEMVLTKAVEMDDPNEMVKKYNNIFLLLAHR